MLTQPAERVDRAAGAMAHPDALVPQGQATAPPHMFDDEFAADALLQSILEAALQAARCDVGAVLIVEPDEHVLRGGCAAGLDAAKIEAMSVPLTGTQTLAADVALTARSAQIDDVATDYR